MHMCLSAVGGLGESASHSIHVNVNSISYLMFHSFQINSVFHYSDIYLGQTTGENYISQMHCSFGIMTLFSEVFHASLRPANGKQVAMSVLNCDSPLGLEYLLTTRKNLLIVIS